MMLRDGRVRVMRAMVLRDPGPVSEAPLHLADLPVPRPGPGEVLIKVTACGVCHTDLHTVEGELLLRHLPLVPGHQVVGVIEEMGPVTGLGTMEASLTVGQRVGVPWLYDACGECNYCWQGLENLCERARFTGLDEDGGYAEYMVAPAAFVYPLPEGFDDYHVAPLLCAGVIGYRSLRLAGLAPGEKLALFGFGASAHLALQVARYWGCEVFVFTRSPHHQELARQLGAAWAGRAGETPPDLADRAITFAPAGDLIPHALRALRKGGTLAINAVHLDHIPEFSYDLLYGERVLGSVTNLTRQDAREFLALAAEIPLQVSVEVFSLEEANQALQALKAGRINGAAVLEVARLKA